MPRTRHRLLNEYLVLHSECCYYDTASKTALLGYPSPDPEAPVVERAWYVPWVRIFDSQMTWFTLLTLPLIVASYSAFLLFRNSASTTTSTWYRQRLFFPADNGIVPCFANLVGNRYPWVYCCCFSTLDFAHAKLPRHERHQRHPWLSATLNRGLDSKATCNHHSSMCTRQKRCGFVVNQCGPVWFGFRRRRSHAMTGPHTTHQA